MSADVKYRFKELRLARGLNQEDMGSLIGVSKGFVSQLENGKREPSAETLQFYADALGIPVASLMISEDAELLEVVHQLSAEDRALILRLSRSLLRDAETAKEARSVQTPGSLVTKSQ